MNLIKKQGIKIFIGIVVIVVLVLAIVAVKKMIFPDDSISLYGNRLDGIKDVPITDAKFKQMASTLKESASVVSVTYDISGRIINFTVDVKKDTDLITARALGDQIIKSFSDKELGFYDLQLFLTCSGDTKSELYPTIGYKHKTSVTFKWNANQ